MNEHDAKLFQPKNRPVKDRDVLQAFADRHPFCQCCGSDRVALHIHHVVGGRGGRSDEHCNLLRLCFRPCHDLADGLTVATEAKWHVKYDENGLACRAEWHSDILPKLPLAVQLSLKLRAGELDAADLARLAVLHGRTLPAPEPIPELFRILWTRNREGK